MIDALARNAPDRNSARTASHHVSVAMATHGGEARLARVIDSLLGRAPPPDERVAVDDGSIEGAFQILDRYGSRVVRLRQSNGGMTAVVNHGLNVAAGDVLGFQDADDMWWRDKPGRRFGSLDTRQETSASIRPDTSYVTASPASEILNGPAADALGHAIRVEDSKFEVNVEWGSV